MRTNSAVDTGELIVRERLLRRFWDAEENLTPFVLLVSPAGSGKSTLAAQLIDSPSVVGTRVYVTHASARPDRSLWRTLADALAQREAAPPVLHEADAREHVRQFVGAMTEPTLLVIDDYHHVSSVENDRALLELSGTSPHLRLCVLARSVHILDGPLYRHRVRVITREDLAFTPAEARDLAAQWGVDVSPALTDALAQAGGWAIAVTALLRSAQSSESSPDLREGNDDPSPRHSSTPHPALQRLAVDILDVLGQLDPAARGLVLAASLVDGLTLKHAEEVLGRPAVATLMHVRTLRELGVITAVGSTPTETFHVHPAVRATVAAQATREISSSKRRALVLRATRDRERGTPLDAFRAYLRFSYLPEAERVLAANFTLITDHRATCLAALDPLTDDDLSTHPTLAAARFFLEFELATVSPKRLWHTSQLSYRGAQRRLEMNPDPDDPLYLAHRAQVMVGERVRGDAPAALAIAKEIEARLSSPAGLVDGDPDDVPSHGPYTDPALLAEIAFTAFMGGDAGLARRAWQKLATLVELSPGSEASASRAGMTRSTVRHGPWLHVALSGLALVESNEGDFRQGAELLARSDDIREAHGPGPALGWVNAEVVRAHHAYEFRRPDLLAQAVARISPWYDRIEQWPMVIMAEAESVRYQRGPDWALPHLRAAVTQVERERHGVGVWGGYLALYQAMLNTTSGNFATSKSMIDSLPAKNSFVQIEQARLALFRSDDVRALLTIQRLGTAALNLRQRIDALLIGAVAAWGCGRTQEAFVSLRDAGELIERCELSMMLRSVPFDPLVEIAAAARDAGVCDITTLIDSVPEAARCVRRESLTHMEQRALESMATHPALADAALALDIAPATVKRHRLAVYRKLRVGSREEAILQATRMGLLPGHGNSG
ncbi:AAA family ATPase [Microbacterium caowuchunii]|uniref:AAA family ATPase n=1 Tax=Microbacterium caowuchunii TaxID=2614638 RepID=UPI0017843982|nr:AAA family ATPase [Microbacterium caowuchunii]